MAEARENLLDTVDARSDGVSPKDNGLATGPRDTVDGTIREAPAEPMDRPGTEGAQGAIDGSRLMPPGRTGTEASREDEADQRGRSKTGRSDEAEG